MRLLNYCFKLVDIIIFKLYSYDKDFKCKYQVSIEKESQ